MKNILPAYPLIILAILITRCEEEESIGLPKLTTTEVTSIDGTSAVSGGTITSDGGAAVTDRGVCWAKDANPTIEDFRTHNEKGTGEFSSSLSDLEENTVYHVRAYATNSVGTAYGDELSFSTFGKPRVQTVGVSSLTVTTAGIVGKILSDGNMPISEKGFCWGTTPSPTIDDDKTVVGGETVDFETTLDELNSNSTYYVRAYATNAIGTSYGGDGLFVTYAVMDVDGNGYHSVTIGTQVWLSQDLKVTKYRNGDLIPNVTDGSAWGNLTSGAYCDYNNAPSNGMTYGRIYNWYAVNESRKIAPVGWHVATKVEFDVLSEFLGGDDVAGGKLKEQGTAHWQSPNSGATNSTGFTALPGGGRGFNNTFGNLGVDCSWWTATENVGTTAFGRYVVFSTDDCHWYSVGKESGAYVRCVKD